jgi:peptidoglycan/LPS O-acetylase OafA/YrhL
MSVSAPSERQPGGHRYRADIDGLRAVAVLAVVVFHAFPRWLPGGFIGVDIFFVISGFLISGILFEKLNTRAMSFADFYIRRIKRIFPSLLLVMVTTLAFGWWVLLGDEFKEFGRHLMGGAGFASNFVFAADIGYFDNSAKKILLHLWSLAIEEQFYFVWPLLLVVVWRRRWNVLASTCAILVMSFVYGLFTLKADPQHAFYSPFARAWELMIGGIAAYLNLRGYVSRPSLRSLQSATGAALIIIGLLLINQSRQFPGWWALLPTAGAFLTISAGPDAWFNQRVLSRRLMVAVGLISYPLYLWHWPLLAFGRIFAGNAVPSRAVRLALVAVAFLLAWLSTELVEKRFRHTKVRARIVLLPATMVACLGLGLLAYVQILRPRNSGPVLDEIVHAAGDFDFPAGLQEVTWGGQRYFATAKDGERVLLLGDSHIQQYCPRLSWLAQRSAPILTPTWVAALGACVPIPGAFEDSWRRVGCAALKEHALALARDPKTKAVILGAYWDYYFTRSAERLAEEGAPQDYYIVQDGQKAFLNRPEGRQLALAALRALITELASEKRVYLLLDNPTGNVFDPKAYMDGSRFAGISVKSIPTTVLLKETEPGMRDELRALARQAGARVLDPVPGLCPGGVCGVTTGGGAFLHKDADHLRPFAVIELGGYLDEALRGP